MTRLCVSPAFLEHCYSELPSAYDSRCRQQVHVMLLLKWIAMQHLSKKGPDLSKCFPHSLGETKSHDMPHI